MQKNNDNIFSCSILKLLILIVFLFIAYRGYDNYRELLNTKNELSNLQRQIELTKERNIELQEKLENINSQEYIEKMAREKLGLVKPGELLLIPIEEK